jgi:trigger factor
MQVSVETVGTLGRRMKIAVPAEQVEKAFSERLQQFSRRVKMPGFRPGKVPAKMIEAQYGGQLLQEVAGDLIEASLAEAIGREGLRPAGGPRIAPQALARGADLQYVAEFEVLPEIAKLDIAGVRIERPTVTVIDADVDRTLETIRKQRTGWRPVPRAAQAGDRVKIDFVGHLDGQPFEGGSAKDFPVVLGGNTLLDDLEKGLLGMSANETRSVPVRFPENYHHAKLAGKTADFEVKVNEVAEPVVPEVDGELAKQLGIEDGSVEKLRAEVRSNLDREAATRIRGILRARVTNALLDANKFDVPQNLVDAEIARLKSQEQTVRGGQGDADKLVDEMYRERARRRVALGLIFGEVVQKRSIRPDAGAVRQRLAELATEYDQPEAFVQWHLSQPERLRDIESMVVEDKLIDEMLAGADVVDTPIEFQDLLKVEATLR